MTAQLLQCDLADFTIFGPEDVGKHQFHNHASTVGDADGLQCESFSTDLVYGRSCGIYSHQKPLICDLCVRGE